MIDQPRTLAPPKHPKDSSYKAIVVIFLFGGLDSYNLLVPHSSCGDLYTSYVQERGHVALKPNQMGLKIDATSSDQPCDTFVLHPKAGGFKKIYDVNEGIFLANTGHLDRKVTKDDWEQGTRTDLFSHTSLEKEAYSIDPFKEKHGTGILGRLLDVFEQNGYTVGPNSLNAETPMLGGDPKILRAVDVLPTTGIPVFSRQHLLENRNSVGDIKPTIMELNSESKPENGVHANYWSQHLVNNWNRTDTLYAILKNNPTLTTFSYRGIMPYFKVISQMIRAHKDRKVNRDAFFVRIGGLDAHTMIASNLNTHIDDLSTSFEAFQAEMKAQNNYHKVTVLMQSEFGRTITPNSREGTDHGWGGNYFMFGGGIKGGRILGDYPKTFWDTDLTNIGRGRLIPTTSWDSLWFGISQWYGVETDADMKYILPNHGSFGCFLLSDKDLYRDGSQTISGCDGFSMDFAITSVLNEPRYLTGPEEKKICEEVLKNVEVQTGQTARCLIIGQKIIVNYSRRLANGEIQDTEMTLKQYLNRGGSRKLNEGHITFSVKVDTTINYEPVQSGTSDSLSVAVMTQRLTDDLGPALQSFVQNMTALDSIVATTSSPTISLVPTQAPTSSPTPLPVLVPTTSPTPEPPTTIILPLACSILQTPKNRIELTGRQLEIFCDAIVDGLSRWKNNGDPLSCAFSGQKLMRGGIKVFVTVVTTTKNRRKIANFISKTELMLKGQARRVVKTKLLSAGVKLTDVLFRKDWSYARIALPGEV